MMMMIDDGEEEDDDVDDGEDDDEADVVQARSPFFARSMSPAMINVMR